MVRESFPVTKLLVLFLALALTVALVSLYYRNNAVVLSVFVLALIAVFVRSKNPKRDAIPFVLGAIFGPTMEIVIIHHGAWQYTNPTFLGIPIWLPLLWGFAALFLGKIAKWFEKAL